MSDVRPAAVAGTFYPDNPHVLRHDIDALLAHASATEAPHAGPKALIVPHAGYIYSGPVAASAYALIAPLRDRIERVVLFGPAHRVAVPGLAMPKARAFETPLGEIPVDAEAVAMLRDMPGMSETDVPHALEHSLEVQLPFLQRVLRHFKIVPIAVGSASAEGVAAVIETLWGGPETLIVISSDLSHYHAYSMAQAIDQATVLRVLDFSPWLDHEQACGATPINALLMCAARRDLRVKLLDLRNSGDTAGDKARVVGYGAFAFFEGTPSGQ